MRSTIAAVAVLIAAGGALAQDTDRRRVWNRPMAPFRIAGQVYHVGTGGLSAYLIADPAGHVLIDGGLPESAPLIEANIVRLGFRMRDVRYLLLSHGHYDHAGGLAALKRVSGATLIAGRGDARDLAAGRTIGRDDIDGFPAVRVDRMADQGSVVRVGRTVVTAHATPGHTSGCTSWTVRTREAGRPLDVAFVCSLTTAGRTLIDGGKPTIAVGEFRQSFARLKRMRADVYLTFHAEFFDLAAKRTRQEGGDARAFIDPREMPRRIATAERGFTTELARQRAAAR